MYHVFYVPALQEINIAEKIKYLLEDKVKVHVFKKIEVSNKKNIMKFSKKNLFPSYIVVETKKWTDNFYYKIKSAGAKKYIGKICKEEFLHMQSLQGLYIYNPKQVKNKKSFKEIIKKIKLLKKVSINYWKYLRASNEIFIPINKIKPLLKKNFKTNLYYLEE